MKNKHKAGILLTLVALLLLAGVTQAQTGGEPEPPAAAVSLGYDISWWTVDSGGVVGAGPPSLYTLSGSIGQPDAGLAHSNGDYVLVGGFWGGALVEYPVYLPLVLRNYQ